MLLKPKKVCYWCGSTFNQESIQIRGCKYLHLSCEKELINLSMRLRK